jgi:integrase
MATLVRRSGVDFHLHALRRMAATNWGRFAQPHVIQSLLGHAWGG